MPTPCTAFSLVMNLPLAWPAASVFWVDSEYIVLVTSYTVSVGTLALVTSAKIPTETVYEITKAMYSEAAQKAIAAGHAKGKFITKENAVQGAGIPFHPGAEKFYKEAGLLK